MTAPTYPGYPPQPQAAPGYPQQFPAPGYPPQPQFAPQYPAAQGYPAPQMAPPPQPLATGTLDDFFNQPSAGGGKSLSFKDKPYGTRYRGIVTRPLGPGDVQQQTDTMQRPQFFRDGRPKFVMKVPLQMQPSPEFPDGLATWFVKGQARDELVRAMAEAGAPAGPPEAGAIVDITYVGERQTGAGMNPAKQVRVIYTRPDGAAQQPAAQPAPPIQQQVPTQAAPAYQPPPAAPQPDPAQLAAQAAVQQQFPQATVQQPAPPVQQPAPPSDLTAEQQALLAKLTGQPAG